MLNSDGAVEPKTESQWKAEGWTPEEISTFSKIGLVLTDPEAEVDKARELRAWLAETPMAQWSTFQLELAELIKRYGYDK